MRLNVARAQTQVSRDDSPPWAPCPPPRGLGLLSCPVHELPPALEKQVRSCVLEQCLGQAGL